jgi:hypothetical protein
MSLIPAAAFPAEVNQFISEAAQTWLRSPARPRPTPNVEVQLDELIDAWIEDQRLPLLIRKGGLRGVVQRHRTGRKVVAVDNSPAHWMLATALLGHEPSIEKVHDALVSGELPVAMIMKASERKAGPTYTGTLGASRVGALLNKKGWKVCHIEEVGLRTRASITDIEMALLRRHFALLMKPSNMFVVPKSHGGFGELPEVLQEMRRMKT